MSAAWLSEGIKQTCIFLLGLLLLLLDGKLLPLFSIDCCLAKRWIFGVEVAVLCLWIIGWVAGNWNEKGYDIDG